MSWLALLLGVNLFPSYSLVILYIFPLPALADWSLHRLDIYEGTNLTRLTTGSLLGLTFATLLYRTSRTPLDPHSWIAAIGYTSIVATVLTLTRVDQQASA